MTAMKGQDTKGLLRSNGEAGAVARTAENIDLAGWDIPPLCPHHRQF